MGKRNKFIFLFEFFFPSSLLPNLRMMDRPFLFDFLVASDPLSNDGWKMLYRIKRETCYVYSWKRWFFPSSVVVSFWTENATWFVWTWRPLLAAHCVKAWRCIKACRRKMKIKGKLITFRLTAAAAAATPFFYYSFSAQPSAYAIVLKIGRAVNERRHWHVVDPVYIYS